MSTPTVSLQTLGLTEEEISSISEDYPQFASVFTDNSSYAIPTELIQPRSETIEVNTDLILELYQTADITPRDLFNYCIDVFKVLSNKTPEDQYEAIVSAEEVVTASSVEDIRSNLTEVQSDIGNATLFDVLQVNYQRQLEQLEKQLRYDESPSKNEVWEISLVNVHGTESNSEGQKITIVVEEFIIPKEIESNTLFDSPAVVRVVGEYAHIDGLNEGDLFVATPAAFTDGTYMTTLE